MLLDLLHHLEAATRARFPKMNIIDRCQCIDGTGSGSDPWEMAASSVLSLYLMNRILDWEEMASVTATFASSLGCCRFFHRLPIRKISEPVTGITLPLPVT